MTSRQAADHLGISLCTLKKIESLGHLKPYRTPGGHRRYSEKMLDNYLEMSKVFSTYDVAEKILMEQGVGELHYNVVMSLMSAIDARDPYSRGHSHRVAANAVVLAERLGMSKGDCGALEAGAYLHDIGKIAVRDEILLERGSLSCEQRLHIEEHPSVGAGILESAGLENDVISVVSSHHERMDGRGYPSGLKGDAIPLGGRIVCVVDSFDAMVSNRPYRSAMPAEVALGELAANAGTQFDSEVVHKFRQAYDETEIVLPRLPGRKPEPWLRELRPVHAVATIGNPRG
jgi:putative nucleotidyltransferase with HDIG domain